MPACNGLDGLPGPKSVSVGMVPCGHTVDEPRNATGEDGRVQRWELDMSTVGEDEWYLLEIPDGVLKRKEQLKQLPLLY